MKNLRKISLASLVVLALLFSGCSGSGMTMSLIDMLSSQLGISPTQALGGAGALLTVAENTLSPEDFKKVTDLVPGSASYLNIAKTVGGATSAMNSLSSVAPVFENLDMEPSMVNQFVPLLTNYADVAGGSDVGSLLSGVLK